MIGIAACISVQIEIRVVGHIDNGRFIRFCLILDIDGIIICQLHNNLTGDITGETFLAVF